MQRMDTDSVTITHIRVPAKIAKRIQKLAEAEHRSRNNMIAVLLADAVAEREAQRK